MTSSPLRILFMASSSDDFRGERHDLHELLGTQFARDRSEDTSADGFELGVEQYGCIATEADERAIFAAHAFRSAHHHGVVDLAFFDAPTGRGFFHAHL